MPDPEDPEDRSEDLGVWPMTTSKWSGAGVVPFGERVLHSPTEPVTDFSDDLEVLAGYMIDVMRARDGIGLAANQVGLPISLFVHALPRVAPDVIVNPVIHDRDDTWEYEEGCLSLRLDGSWAKARRPKRIVVEAQTVRGDGIRIAADELLARVFQHEIDHLNGVVYVQRLERSDRSRVYEVMHDVGVDTSLFPPLNRR